MNLFDDIKSDWNRQEKPIPQDKGAENIIERVADIRKKNRWTVWILTVTFIGVVLFFWHYGALGSPDYGWPVGLMLGGVFIRILAELWGQSTLRRINPGQDARTYSQRLRRFYGQRKWVHYGLTPLALGAYVWGFVILMPVVRSELSPGLYAYVQISGVVILVALLWLIIRELRRELRMLQSLCEEV